MKEMRGWCVQVDVCVQVRSRGVQDRQTCFTAERLSVNSRILSSVLLVNTKRIHIFPYLFQLSLQNKSSLLWLPDLIIIKELPPSRN